MWLASLASVGKSRLTNLSLSIAKQPQRTLFRQKSPATKKIFANSSGLVANFKLIRPHAGMVGGPGGGGINGRRSPMKASQIISQLFRFVWPKDRVGIKIRVVVALGLLVGSKLLNVAVPFVFKEIVDLLNKNAKIKDFASTTEEKIVLGMIVLVIGYGAARAGASLFGELRNAVFARVAQSSVTQLATRVKHPFNPSTTNVFIKRDFK